MDLSIKDINITSRNESSLVSILILMDLSIKDERVDSRDIYYVGFNPYFNGSFY